MTGKGLLACIDLAWIGLALASLVWSEAQPGIGGQAVSLSCCQVASWHWPRPGVSGQTWVWTQQISSEGTFFIF